MPQADAFDALRDALARHATGAAVVVQRQAIEAAVAEAERLRLEVSCSQGSALRLQRDAAVAEAERLRAREAEATRLLTEGVPIVSGLASERDDLLAECERLRAENAAHDVVLDGVYAERDWYRIANTQLVTEAERLRAELAECCSCRFEGDRAVLECRQHAVAEDRVRELEAALRECRDCFSFSDIQRIISKALGEETDAAQVNP